MDGATIILILNCVLVLFCLIGLLFGLVRGFKKAGLRLVFFILSLGITLIVTPMVTNLLSNINLSFLNNMTLEGFINNMLLESEGVSNLLADMPSLEIYISALPAVVLNLVVYVLLLYIINFIIYIVYAIVAKILFKKKKKEDYKLQDKKPKKRRLLGALVGTAQGFILLIATFVPLTGILNIANSAIYTNAVVAASEEKNSKYTALGNYLLEENIINEEVLSYLDYINQSVIVKSSHFLGADSLVFDSIAKIEVNGEKIALRQEILCITDAVQEADFLLEFLSNSENLKLENITVEQWTKLEKSIDRLLELKTLKILLPEIIPAAVKQAEIPEIEGIDITDNVNKVIDLMCQKESFIESFKLDVKAVINIFKVLKQNEVIGLLTAEEIDQDLLLEKLAEDKNSDGEKYDTLLSVLDHALDSKTLRNVISEAVNVGIKFAEKELNNHKVEGDNTVIQIAKVDTENVNWNNQKDSFKNILKSILTIYENIDVENFSDFNDIYNYNYELIVDSACSAINELVQSPLLKTGVNQSNVYDSLMSGLNSTKFGEYINFSSTAASDFWSQNSQLLKDGLKYYKDYKDYTDVNEVLDNLDYDTLESLLARVLDSTLLNCFKTNAFEYLQDQIPSSVYEGQFGESIKAAVEKIVNDLVEHNTTLGGMKYDVLAMYNIAREIIENDLIETFKQTPLNVTEVFKIIAKEDSNHKNIADRLVEHFMSAPNTKRIFIDVLNLGEEVARQEIEKLTGEDFTLTQINADNIDWTMFESELQSIFETALSVEFLEEEQVINFQGKEIKIPVDIPSSIEKAGKVLDDIKNLEIFNYANGNIIDDILVELNKKYSSYLDLSSLVGKTSVQTQFGALKTIAECIIESGVLTDLSNSQFDVANINISEIANKLSQTNTYNGVEKSYINVIVATLVENGLVKPSFKSGIEYVNDFVLKDVETKLSEIANEEVELIINSEAIDDESSKANIVAFFDNLCTYIKSVDYEELKTDTVKTLLSSNLTLVGSLFDNLKSNNLFGEFEIDGSNYKGLYISLFDALAKSQFNDFVNFEVAKENSFRWNSELSSVQGAINSVLDKQITFIKDEMPVTKSLFDFIKDGEDASILIDYFTGEDVDNIIAPLISSELFVPTVKLFVNFGIDAINEIIDDPNNSIEKIVSYANFKDQKDEIIRVIKGVIGLTKLESFELSQTNNIVIGSFMNALNLNANRASGDGVFKGVYDGLVNYLVTLENGGEKLQLLLDEYTNPLNVEWVELLNLALENENLLDSSNKAQIQSLFTRIYQDAEYGLISGYMVDIYVALTQSSTDVLEVLVGDNGLPLLKNCNSQKTMNFIDFIARLTENELVAKLVDYDVTDDNNIKVLKAFNENKTTLTDIDGVIALLDDLILIDDSDSVNNTIDFANRFVTIQGLDTLKNTNLLEEKQKLVNIQNSISSLSTTSTQTEIDDLVDLLASNEAILETLPSDSIELPSELSSLVTNSIENNVIDEEIKNKLKLILGL